MSLEKFSSQMNGETLAAIRRFSKESGRSLSDILSEAAEMFLQKYGVRPVFRETTERVLSEHDELIRKLAK